MKIVLVGAGGKLGGYLRRAWEESHQLSVLTRAEVDLRDGGSLRRELEDLDFEALVNCAAMASPEACEEDREGAVLVNALAPEVMARVCAERGARMVHFSTDYVVDGSEARLKDETAPVASLGNYGSSKLDGERRVLDACPGALVCRVSWIFGAGVPSFMEAVIRRARAGETLEAVADKWSKPTSVRDIAASVERLLGMPGASGVLHLVNGGDPVSWWDYADRVLALAARVGLVPDVGPVDRRLLSEVPQLTAPRPVHTALGSARQESLLGASLPPWELRVREEFGAWADRECH